MTPTPPAPPTTPAVATLPAGWKDTPAATPGRPASHGYRRTDGAQVFFDRRHARADNPTEALRPGWDWLARRPDGAVLGHCVSSPDDRPGEGLFLPRKFKTPLEAMRALDAEAPMPGGDAPPAPPPLVVSPAVPPLIRPIVRPLSHPAATPALPLHVALAKLEAARHDLHGPDGTLIPRLGLDWEHVNFDEPLTLAAIADPGDPARVHAALADPRVANAGRHPVTPLGTENLPALRARLDGLLAQPSPATAAAVREFLDDAVRRLPVPAPTPPPPPRPGPKRIPLQAATGAPA